MWGRPGRAPGDTESERLIAQRAGDLMLCTARRAETSAPRQGRTRNYFTINPEAYFHSYYS